MSPVLVIGLYLLIFIVAAVLFKTPVGFAMGLSAIVMFAVTGLTTSFYSQGFVAALDNFAFLAVPYFIFAGDLMKYSGLSSSLIGWVDSIAGRIRGSLGTVTILASAAFGVLTGSNMATQSTIGKIMIPEMINKGYRRSYAAALSAATCFLGTFIPPSVPGIMYALAAGQKVSEVWLSTLFPGFLFAGIYIAYNTFSQWNTESAKTEPFELKKYSAEIGKSTVRAIPALIMPIIIFGGIYGGICTATEAGGVSALYGLLYLIFNKFFRKKDIEKNLYGIAKESMITTAIVCALLAFSKTASYIFTLTGVSDALAVFIVEYVHSKFLFLVFINILFLFLGTFMDLNSGIMIMTPLLLPSAQAMGLSPIHFGAIMICNLNIGCLTPPLAGSLYFGAAMAEADTWETIKDEIPFILIGIFCMILISAFPWLSEGAIALFS